MNSGGIYRDAKRREVYTDPEGDSRFSIYQISWIKMKKVTFCKLKTSLQTLFTIYKHFGDFVKYVFTILLQIQHESNLLPTSKHRQAKVRRLLGICFYECFIYRSNFVFPKMSRSGTPSWLQSQTVNSQGYSELLEPIKIRESCYSLIW